MHRLATILDSRQAVVVKIGTNLLADKSRGINPQRIDAIARGVCAWRSLGRNVVVVSSGAIGAGVAALNLKARPKTIPEKQATAAIGQPLLMEAYERAFRAHGCPIAQMLLTRDDFVSRTRYVNARNTFTALFEHGVVPIINENDSVAVDEIKVGDNDNLSALVANLIEAGLLIVLTDIAGLFSDDPSRNANAALIPLVERITPQIERLAKSSGSELSTGGMITKIQAARRCVRAGTAVIIAGGRDPNILQTIASGTFTGTLFLPSDRKMNRRRQWIGFIAHAKGAVVVDEGARAALVTGKKSLLATGITAVQGEFRVGDTIAVRDASGTEIARGISGFSSAELGRIKGKRTADIARLLGSARRAEVIHRDNLALTGGL